MGKTPTISAAGQPAREKILLVDDSYENLVALEAVLESLGQELIKASSGLEALRHCLEHDFAAVILDVKMPEMDGFETASLIRARKRSQHTPILFLTAFRNEEHLFRGYDLGAVDFLFKPIVSEVLQSKVSVFIELSRNAGLLRSQAREIRNLNIDLERRIEERTAELVQDIAERKRTEQALRESEQRLRVAIQAANLGLWSIDCQTGIVSASERTYEMLGLPNDSVHDVQSWTSSIDPKDRDNTRESLAAALAGDGELNCEFRVAMPEANVRWIACRGSLFQDGEQSPRRLVGVSQDVTDRKHTDEMVQHRHKLESLGILAGGIAHDFNNLLTGVLGHASIILDDERLDGSNRQSVENIVLAAESAAQLTRQMLAYSGRGRFVVEPVHLSRRIRELQPLLLAALPKNVRFELELAEDLPHVEMDTAQVQQLILNLVMNASEAIGSQNGVVKVATKTASLTDEILRQVAEGREIQLGRYVALEVRDNGHGMDETTVARIFDPFFTTKFTGRGLGLSAVLGIVRGHKGAIHISSQPGEGTTFVVYFPPSGLRAAKPDRPRSRATERGHGVVLVVDDEDVVRKTAKLALERQGFTVVEAQNGQECIELFTVSPTRFDVVLLDMAMPMMSGEETFKKLMAIRPDTPVVASSGYDETETLRRFGSGLAGFIQKPYTASQLTTKIKSVVATCSPFR